MKNDNDPFLTIGNMDLKITKEGTIMIRSHEGIAVLEPNYGISSNKKTVKLGSSFTTTSTTWTVVTGLTLGEKEKTLLKKILLGIYQDRQSLIEIAKIISDLLSKS